MIIRKVDAEEYFNNLPEKVLDHSKEKVEDTMNQVINRFELRGKSILCIGSGLGYEEYWFYKAQCKLTMLDIGYNYILRQTKESLTPSLVYIIGDIKDIVKEYEEKYDFIYTSGMSCDLMWNENGKNGLANILFEYIRNFLDKGLFIFQSYHGGLEMDKPESIEILKKQCDLEDVYLVSIYHFIPQYLHVALITIFKGSEDELNEYMESIKGNMEITRFHGRAPTVSKINKVYQLGDS